MNGFGVMRPLTLGVMCLLTIGCGRQPSERIQGYVEGEFVYVSSPLAGTVETLSVQRGAQVKKGDPLFILDRRPEQAAVNEAKQRLAQARSNLEDAKKGRRPSEIESLEAQLKQAQAARLQSEQEFNRQDRLIRSGAAATEDYEKARSTRDQDRQRVAQLEADLATARLGARSDQIAAAEFNGQALEATLARAEWDLEQKRLSAPEAGLVFDTLYRQGEWAAAGKPVVMLLPPRNIKVRAFVPETRIGSIRVGGKVQVSVDGVDKPFMGKVSYISARAEYTPPVIYSNESRAKLVFMVESTFDPETAAMLHPGQPVDVKFED